MTGGGEGCKWYQSIGLYFLYIADDLKKIVKDHGPLNGQNVFERLNNPPCNLFN
jgi:hypothetical protein